MATAQEHSIDWKTYKRHRAFRLPSRHSLFSVLVVALGIAESGEKHVLGVWQGATENTTVVKGLLEDLVDRGLDLQRRYLVVIDGSKDLSFSESEAVLQIDGNGVIRPNGRDTAQSSHY